MTALPLDRAGAGRDPPWRQPGIALPRTRPEFRPLDLEHPTTIARSRANGSLYHGRDPPTSHPLVGAAALERSCGCWHVSRLQARTDGLVALVSQAALQAWRKLMGVVGAEWRLRPDPGS